MWGEKEKGNREAGFGQEFYTFLGKGVDFKGKAQFEGTVRVDGNFEGDITIDDTLIIGETAVLIGDVHTPTFAMEEGVYFQGECDMGAAPNLDMDLEEGVLSNGQGKTSSVDLEKESLSL